MPCLPLGSSASARRYPGMCLDMGTTSTLNLWLLICGLCQPRCLSAHGFSSAATLPLPTSSSHQYLYRSFHRCGVSRRATLPSTPQSTLCIIIASNHSSDPVCAWTWERTPPISVHIQYTFHGHGSVRCGTPWHMLGICGP